MKKDTMHRGGKDWETAREMCRALFDFLDRHGNDDDDFQPVYVALDDLRDALRQYDEDNGQLGVEIGRAHV